MHKLNLIMKKYQTNPDRGPPYKVISLYSSKVSVMKENKDYIRVKETKGDITTK